MNDVIFVKPHRQFTIRRRESKLSVPDRNEETLVSNTPGIPDISIHHVPEIKGSLLELKKKGLKINDYKDIPRPRRR